MLGRSAGIALVAAFTCAFEPARDVALEPLAVYREWWAQVERCSGRSGRFDLIAWYELPAGAVQTRDGPRLGRTVGKSVWIHPEYTANRVVVSHEMLHVLVGSRHGYAPWNIPCRLWPVGWEDLAK